VTQNKLFGVLCEDDSKICNYKILLKCA
jgi:hypothetical protein